MTDDPDFYAWLDGELPEPEASAMAARVAADPELAADDERVLPIQINGKRRGEIKVKAGAAEDEVQKIALADPNVMAHLEGLTVRKVIVVKDRIVNIVAN